ncbi:MAG: glycosyltransferase [Aristaeellaceae bacterium]
MNRSDNAQPLVSIIIPVYNAEKYLGYCLNSVMRQSHTRIEAVVINDGSTDGSLEICRRYAIMDSRFKVFDIPNGGVSNARNLGISKAQGEYFVLLDSDDVIHPDAIAWMLEAEAQAHTGLVIGNVQMVDFDTGEVLPTQLNSSYAGDHRHYTREEFRQNRMRLIWHTSLLEGVYSKMYHTQTWKDQHIQVPTDVSLGEDFIANMQYFDACNGVYFLDRVVYYYNNVQNSNSLSHKFRPDLFQNKMMLVDKLEQHLGGRGNLSPEELACFNNYMASSGLFCVRDILTTQSASREDKLQVLRTIGSSEPFMQALAKAEYIPPVYERYVPLLLKHKPEALLNLPDKAVQKPAAKPRKAAQPQAGFVNRAMRKCLRTGAGLMGQSVVARKMRTLEKSLADYGIRRTLAYYSPKALRSRRTRKDMNKLLGQQTEKMLTAQSSQMEALRAAIASCVEERTRDVKDYVYLSETRQRNVLRRQLTSELRQKKKALLLCTAEHQNIGDAAITLAEQTILRRQFPDYFQVEYSTYEQPEQYAFIQSIVNEDDIIFISGGGNLGSSYPAEEVLHRRIIADFPENRIVIMPQTIHFADDENGRRELALSQEVYNAHPDLTIFTRGRKSLAFAQQYFPNARSFLMPDAVFALHRTYTFEREGVLLCLRDDQEGVLSGNERLQIIQQLNRMNMSIDYSNNIAEQDVPREDRARVVNTELRRFAHKKLVVTDRLHGMIFSAVTGTPVIALSAAGSKLGEFYEAFFTDCPSIRYMDTLSIDELCRAVEEFSALDKCMPVSDAMICQIHNLVCRS